MLSWQPLQRGDKVAIVAPSARYSGNNLNKLKEILARWQLIAIIPENLQGNDMLCANTDELRWQHLQNALLDDTIKAIWCLRGGYGSTRLIPKLLQLPPPKAAKLFIGFSDITALHIVLQQHWHWATLHAPLAGQLADDAIPEEVLTELQQIMFGKRRELNFYLIAMNTAAQQTMQLEGILTGGNLCLITSSLATPWQINAQDKILLLEDVGERGYRIDRMLVQLEQAGIFNQVKAIILGDFTGGLEADGTSTIPHVLERFAANCQVPVVNCPGIGHDKINHPIALGTQAYLQLGDKPSLSCTTGST
jgi:muramoyltetrapeptide carboxypeptidase